MNLPEFTAVEFVAIVMSVVVTWVADVAFNFNVASDVAAGTDFVLVVVVEIMSSLPTG